MYKRATVHRGLAVTHGFGSFVAACAEVSVKDDGTLKVHRIVAATDSGYAVNPQQIEAQVEGSFAYGLSAAVPGMHDEGRQDRADKFPRLDAGQDGRDAGSGNVGRDLAATGKRIRDLPLKNHSLKKA